MRPYQVNLSELCWQADRLGEAVEWLARASGLLAHPAANGARPAQPADQDWQQQVDLCAAALGVEAEPITCPYGKLVSLFQTAAPAILQFPASQEGAAPLFMALKKSGRRRCTILKPDMHIARLDPEIIAEAFRQPLAAGYQGSAEQLLEMASIPQNRQRKVGRALINSWLGTDIIPVGWLLRPSPAASLKTHIRQTSLIQELAGWMGAFAAQQILFLLSWWLIGRVILGGETDGQWIWVWILLLVSSIPFQLAVTWMQNRFIETVGVIFKQKLLYGALRMNPDHIRHLGMGQILERVMETEAVEMLAIGGGLTAVISIGQLAAAGWVLSKSAGGGLSVAVLALWLAAILAAGGLNYNSGKKAASSYRNMTNGLVEKMVGHRTRLAQENPAHRHDQEDLELDEYQALTHQFSRTARLFGAIPAAWLAAGLACFVPALLSEGSTYLPGMVVGLGGVMLAYQAFGVVQSGIQNVILLLLSWEQVKPIYRAASDREEPPTVTLQTRRDPQPSRQPILTAHDLSYRFQPHRRPALQDCHLLIYSGDRIILEGPSGGGKTTLAAILAGLRQPDSGLLFLHGYDRQSLGDSAWRKRVVMAPQFHENYIFNDTFAFNLLMGRRWPAQPEDMQEAEAICSELGLGELLGRMPSGWQQMVGENGWQLSHGERSRVFIARALLQHADLVIMDESFGALDPENLYLALACACRRASTLLVIAHP